MLREIFYPEKDEKYHILATETPIFVLSICSILATSIIFSILLYIGFVVFEKDIFLIISKDKIDGLFLAISAVTISVISIAALFIRRAEYKCIMKSYNNRGTFRLGCYFLNIFFFLLLLYPAFAYYYKLLINVSFIKYEIAIIPVLILFVLIISWVLRNSWDLFFRKFLQLFSTIDWQLELDRKKFEEMIVVKFTEVMRYQGPLSLMLFGIKNLDELKSKYSKRKIKKLQYKAVDFINDSVRNLDLVGRIEEGQFIAALMHTAGVEAKIPAERVLNKLSDINFYNKKGNAIKVKFCLGIASYDQTLENESDLIDKAKEALQQAVDTEKSIVFL